MTRRGVAWVGWKYEDDGDGDDDDDEGEGGMEEEDPPYLSNRAVMCTDDDGDANDELGSCMTMGVAAAAGDDEEVEEGDRDARRGVLSLTVSSLAASSSTA